MSQVSIFIDAALKLGLWTGTTAPTQFSADTINFTKLELTPAKQAAARILSRMEGTVGDVLASVPRPTGDPATLVGELDRGPRELIALSLGADVTDLAISEEDVVDAPVTLVLNVFVLLSRQWIDPTSFVLETDGGAGADVVVDAAKYVLDEINGLIMAVHADAVGAKLASFSVAATAGSDYQAGKAKNTYVMLLGTCTDQIGKTRGRLVIPRVNLSSDGSFDVVAGAALKGMLKGDMETITGYPAPWRYQASTRSSPY